MLPYDLQNDICAVWIEAKQNKFIQASKIIDDIEREKAIKQVGSKLYILYSVVGRDGGFIWLVAGMHRHSVSWRRNDNGVQI
jgi:hypothetical protein